VLRLRITELLDRHNEGRPREERLTIQDVADTVNIPRGTLAPLNSFNRAPVTNTAYVEALVRYFQRLLPGLEPGDIFEFDPPLERTTTVRVDELYPNRKGQPRETAGNAETGAAAPRRRPRRVRR
jgi:hypothetical protein